MEVVKSKKSTKNVKTQDNSNCSKELIKREDMKDSPFQVVTTKGQSFGIMGEYRITEMYETVEEVKRELERMTWNRLVQVVMILITKNNK